MNARLTITHAFCHYERHLGSRLDLLEGSVVCGRLCLALVPRQAPPPLCSGHEKLCPPQSVLRMSQDRACDQSGYPKMPQNLVSPESASLTISLQGRLSQSF